MERRTEKEGREEVRWGAVNEKGRRTLLLRDERSIQWEVKNDRGAKKAADGSYNPFLNTKAPLRGKGLNFLVVSGGSSPFFISWWCLLNFCRAETLLLPSAPLLLYYNERPSSTAITTTHDSTLKSHVLRRHPTAGGSYRGQTANWQKIARTPGKFNWRINKKKTKNTEGFGCTKTSLSAKYDEGTLLSRTNASLRWSGRRFLRGSEIKMKEEKGEEGLWECWELDQGCWCWRWAAYGFIRCFIMGTSHWRVL